VETRSVLVPLYVHPAVDPAAWAGLARAAHRVHAVVLNAGDGPGEIYDPAFTEAAGRLLAEGVRVLGYVDTAYGERPLADLVAEAHRHQEWYGADGVFFDQTASGPELLPYYEELARLVRASGLRAVVLNPGVHPDPGYAGIADVLVTFEGDWRAYRRAPVPGWVADHPAGRFCHLVHGVPAGLSDLAARIAARRGAALHCAVNGGAPNPWDTLPETLREDAVR
jgi:hypothetical protein